MEYISKQNNNYYFYQCVTDRNNIKCEKVELGSYNIKENSQLIPINKMIPSIFHKPIIYSKMTPNLSVSIK
jgi:hypothetical protein